MMGLLSSFNKFAKIAEAMHTIEAALVKEVAHSIVDDYALLAPTDTGFMASSGYVVAIGESTWGQTSVPPPGDSYLVPEVNDPPDELTAYAAVAANYAEFVELGTRFMARISIRHPDRGQHTDGDRHRSFSRRGTRSGRASFYRTQLASGSRCTDCQQSTPDVLCVVSGACARTREYEYPVGSGCGADR